MIDEISGSIKQRLESPVLGTFSISMMIANWKFALILFSSLDYAEKLQKADGYLKSLEFVAATSEALVATLFILFVVPVIRDYFVEKEIERNSKIIRKKYDTDIKRNLELSVETELLKEATKFDEKVVEARNYIITVEQLLAGLPNTLPQHYISSGAGDKIGNAIQNAAYAKDSLVRTMDTLTKFKASMIKFQLLQDEAIRKQNEKNAP